LAPAGRLTDELLEQRLFSRAGTKPPYRHRPAPDWAAVARELKRQGVNLMILWEEYRASHPADGYAYSRFCDLFREFERRLSPSMRQNHVAGDKVFVDYSGKKISIVNPVTGEIHEAELFVAVLGASSYTYAEATWTQTLPDWISSHVRMFEFFGGVTSLIVPDSLKSGVNKSSFYEPDINRSYLMMAEHYGVAILPARPRRPKDKAKVEAGVRFAQNHTLGRMRNQTFFSLEEANTAASRQRRLKLQTDLGKALMWSRGFGTEESKAAFVRARELAAAIDNETERFTIYFGLWVGNVARGELGLARETAETFLREAERGARTTECGVGHRLLGATCLWRGDFIEAQVKEVDSNQNVPGEMGNIEAFSPNVHDKDSELGLRAFKWRNSRASRVIDQERSDD
jgi:transposase